jgi:hypothetical protein
VIPAQGWSRPRAPCRQGLGDRPRRPESTSIAPSGRWRTISPCHPRSGCAPLRRSERQTLRVARSTRRTPRVYGVVGIPSSFGPSEAIGVAAAVIRAGAGESACRGQEHAAENALTPGLDHRCDVFGFVLDEQRPALLDTRLLPDDELPGDDRGAGHQPPSQRRRNFPSVTPYRPGPSRRPDQEVPLRNLIDRPSIGATSCCRLRHLTTAGTGWSASGLRA